MSSIDERIVEMRFQNGQFEKGVRNSMSTLEKLKSALKLDGAAADLNNIFKKAPDPSALNGMASALEKIKSRFSILGAVGFTAISRLTNAAMDFGKKLIGNVIGPITDGGLTRAMNLEQARFQFQGLGMDVEASMESALAAVKGTAFGLDEAAVVAAQFGASGMRAGTDMTNALTGISGVAAMAGSSYSDIGRIFTKVAGQGRLMGDDLLSLGARGVNAAATLGKAMGKTEAEVRDMVTKGQIDFKTFADAMADAFGKHATRANETYTGSLSNLRSALARIGAAHYEKRLTAMRDIFNATTPVVDALAIAITPLIDLLNTNFRSGADTLIGVLGDVDLTALTKAAPVVARGLQAIIDALTSVGKEVLGAFKDIIPPMTVKNVMDLAKAFERFAKGLKPSEATLKNLRSTFRGLFAVVDIVRMVFVEVLKTVFDLLGGFGGLGGGILAITGSFGEWLVTLRDSIRDGKGLTTFFEGLRKVLKYPIDGIKKLISWIGKLFGKFEGTDPIAGRMGSWEKIGSVLTSIWEGILSVFGAIGDLLAPFGKAIMDFFGDFGQAIANAFKDADFSTILDIINTGLLGAIAILFKSSLGGGLGKFIKDLFFGAKKMVEDEGLSIVDHFKEILGGVTEALGAMQNALNAATLVAIAAAILALTIAIVALAGIDSGKLAKSLVGIGAMMGLLSGMAIVLSKFIAGPAALKLPFIAGALISLSIALVILSSAVKRMSDLDWEEIAKGLVGVAGMLAALGLFTTFAKYGKGQVLGGAGMMLLATALVILGKAIEPLSQMSWEELAKGLTAIAVALAIFAGAMTIMPVAKLVAGSGALVVLSGALIVLEKAIDPFSKMSWEEMAKGLLMVAGSLAGIAGAMWLMPAAKMVVTAGSLVVVSGALVILAGVMDTFSGFSWEGIAKSLVLLAGALASIAGAMWLMPPSMIVTAGALVVVTGALMVLGDVMQSFGKMAWQEIAKSLVMLAGSLGILAGGLYLMTAALPGAAALIVASGALAILAPVMISLGKMSWGEIGKGLVILAGSLAVLAVAGVALTPALPSILGLAAAVAAVGAAIALAGGGIMAFGTGLSLMAAAGAAGVAVLGKALEEIITLIPKFLIEIAKGVIEFVKVLGNGAPDVARAVGQLLTAIVLEVNRLTPELTQSFAVMILKIMVTLERYLPEIREKGTSLVTKLMEGIGADAPKLVASGVFMLLQLSQGLRNQMPILHQEALDLITTFLITLGLSIRANSSEMSFAGGFLADALLHAMTGGILGGKMDVEEAARILAGMPTHAKPDSEKSGSEVGKGFTDELIKKILDGGDPVEGAAKEITGEAGNAKPTAEKEGTGVGEWFVDSLLGAISGGKLGVKETAQETTSATEMSKPVSEAAGKAVAGGFIGAMVDNIFTGKVSVEEIAKSTARITGNAEGTSKGGGTKVANGFISSLVSKIFGGNGQVTTASKSTAGATGKAQGTSDSQGKKVGGGFISNLVRNIFGGGGKVSGAAKSTAGKVRDGRGNAESSGKSVGNAAASGMAKGVSNGKGQVQRSANSVASSASAAKGSGRSGGSSVGGAIASGMSRGLNNGRWSLLSTARSVARAALNAAKNALGIRSPSREFQKLGMFSMQGFANGFSKNGGLPVKEAIYVADNLLLRVKDVMKTLPEKIDDELDLSPRITPILDLDNIKRPLIADNLLLRMDGSDIPDRSRQRAEHMNRIQIADNLLLRVNPSDQVGREFHLTQINNSPKALSPATIYRQTKNLMSTVSGG